MSDGSIYSVVRISWLCVPPSHLHSGLPLILLEFFTTFPHTHAPPTPSHAVLRVENYLIEWCLWENSVNLLENFSSIRSWMLLRYTCVKMLTVGNTLHRLLLFLLQYLHDKNITHRDLKVRVQATYTSLYAIST